jgi:DNA-directed RNA polymerase II subunit RPB1
LVQELRNVLKPYGIYVNYRHISILCDLMTQKGILTSITRHGLNKSEYGPIRKASFEETVEILLEAGIFSEKDELKGISENILLGKLTNVGTGFFELLIDFNAFENESKRNEDDYQMEEEELVINSNYEAGDNMNTPVVQNTPLYNVPRNISFSTYDNQGGNFTPAPDYNNSSMQSPFAKPGGSIYKGDSSFISTPNPSQKYIPPSSPDYNPQSDYIKTPAPYSPLANEEYRIQSEYMASAYSPRMSSPSLNTGSGQFYSRRVTQGTGRGPNSTYSPTTPGMMRPSSGNSPQCIQGSGIYNSIPKAQDSMNSSQYAPASPNYYPTSPVYNLAINNASPFYKQDKNEDDDEEEEDEDEDNNKKDGDNNEEE